MAQPKNIARAAHLYDNIGKLKQQCPDNPFMQRLMSELEITVHRLLLYAQQKSPLARNNAFKRLEERLRRCTLSSSSRQEATREDISLKKIAALH